MSKTTLAVRTLLGLGFTVFGFLFFITPAPQLPEGPMNDFFKGMAATGYFFYLLKGTETVCGLLLLTGQFVPLALVVLAPILVNIFFVHLFMAPEGIAPGLILGLMTVYLAFFSKEYSPTIKALFRRK